jgi:hypothetical protein
MMMGPLLLGLLCPVPSVVTKGCDTVHFGGLRAVAVSGETAHKYASLLSMASATEDDTGKESRR